MKSALVIDCDVNATTLPEYLKPAMRWRRIGETLHPYLPTGTMFDERSGVVTLQDSGGGSIKVPQALLLCKTGQAAAVDEECAMALGMTPEQARVEQRRYAAGAAGIKGANDLKLFMAEVIDGYLPGTTDAKPIYKHGKYWASYAEATATKEDDE